MAIDLSDIQDNEVAVFRSLIGFIMDAIVLSHAPTLDETLERLRAGFAEQSARVERGVGMSAKRRETHAALLASLPQVTEMVAKVYDPDLHTTLEGIAHAMPPGLVRMPARGAA